MVLIKVPDKSEGWENDFIIPTQYSVKAMGAIAKGQLTSQARREIVQSISSKMLNNAKYPTITQVDVVSSKIIVSIKGTRDRLGTGYVSTAHIDYHLLIVYSFHAGFME